MLSSKADSSEVTLQAAWVSLQGCASHAVNALGTSAPVPGQKVTSSARMEEKIIYLDQKTLSPSNLFCSPAVISLVAVNSFSRYHRANVLQQNYPTGFCSSRQLKGSWGFCGSRLTEVSSTIKAAYTRVFELPEQTPHCFPRKAQGNACVQFQKSIPGL